MTFTADEVKRTTNLEGVKTGRITISRSISFLLYLGFVFLWVIRQGKATRIVEGKQRGLPPQGEVVTPSYPLVDI